jgi:hypothetical protein
VAGVPTEQDAAKTERAEPFDYSNRKGFAQCSFLPSIALSALII